MSKQGVSILGELKLLTGCEIDPARVDYKES